MLQQAHVVPESESTWFAINGMRRYTVEGLRHGFELLNNVENKLLLRSDLHALWDSRAFVLVPKRGDVRNTVVHVLLESVELLALYHNRLTQPLHARRELLFARLAWALFPYVRSFLNARRGRRVAMRTETSDVTVRMLSADQCSAIAEQRKRSASPKKRKGLEDVASGTVYMDELQLASDFSFRSDSSTADSGYAPANDTACDKQRSLSDTFGRPRKRRVSGSLDAYCLQDYAEQEQFGPVMRGRKRRRTSESG